MKEFAIIFGIFAAIILLCFIAAIILKNYGDD